MKLHPNICSIAAAFVCSLGLFSSAAQAQILLNGGFEQPTPTPVSGAGTAWTLSGTASIVPNGGAFGNTPFDSQFLNFSSGATISQTITGFIAGNTYVLGADYADLAGGPAPQLTLSISGAATSSQSFNGLVQGPAIGTIQFQSGFILFTAASTGSATITLANSGSSALALDNVALFGNIVTVPEPSTWALMLAGLGFLAVWRSRRSIS